MRTLWSKKEGKIVGEKIIWILSSRLEKSTNSICDPWDAVNLLFESLDFLSAGSYKKQKITMQSHVKHKH